MGAAVYTVHTSSKSRKYSQKFKTISRWTKSCRINAILRLLQDYYLPSIRFDRNVRPNMRSRIPEDTWDQAKTAYASGIGLRELARRMGIPEGTMLARASREHWARRIKAAKSLAQPLERAIVPVCDAAAATMHERGVRHVERMARITEKVLPHLETMGAGEILDRARNVERFDLVARRNFGLDRQPPASGILNISVLGNHTAIKISDQP